MLDASLLSWPRSYVKPSEDTLPTLPRSHMHDLAGMRMPLSASQRGVATDARRDRGWTAVHIWAGSEFVDTWGCVCTCAPQRLLHMQIRVDVRKLTHVASLLRYANASQKSGRRRWARPQELPSRVVELKFADFKGLQGQCGQCRGAVVKLKSVTPEVATLACASVVVERTLCCAG